MPSGITHILLVKELLNRIEPGKLRQVLDASMDFLQVGAIAPDLPYTDAVEELFVGAPLKVLADRFHYEKTNDIPEKAFARLRHWKELGRNEIAIRHAFAFFVGYAAHVVADGIVHPFVRDKVGDYADHKDAHRVLEMQLDVLFYNRFVAPAGVELANFNESNLHDELKNVSRKRYPDLLALMELFTELIGEVYGTRCEPEHFLKWIETMHMLLGAAEGEHGQIFKNFGPIKTYLYPDIGEIKSRQEEILTLGKPVDRDANFLGKDRVRFYEDIVPQFFDKFIPIVKRAYECVYNAGPLLSEADIPCIDLDTGRLVGEDHLEITPKLWA